MQQELIEMLEKLLNWYDYIGSDSYYSKDTGKLTEEAEALLEKAKNNAPAVPQDLRMVPLSLLQEVASAFTTALDIRLAQGWNLTGNAIPVLYTDTINDYQVRRDDVWLCTTDALKTEQEVGLTDEQKQAVQVMQWLDSGEWELVRSQPLSFLTDEANAESAWLVRRQAAPYCDKSGTRQWAAKTAFGAFTQAITALRAKGGKL